MTASDDYEIVQLRKSVDELTSHVEGLTRVIEGWNPVHDMIEMLEAVIEPRQGRHRLDGTQEVL